MVRVDKDKASTRSKDDKGQKARREREGDRQIEREEERAK